MTELKEKDQFVLVHQASLETLLLLASEVNVKLTTNALIIELVSTINALIHVLENVASTLFAVQKLILLFVLVLPASVEMLPSHVVNQGATQLLDITVTWTVN